MTTQLETIRRFGDRSDPAMIELNAELSVIGEMHATPEEAAKYLSLGIRPHTAATMIREDRIDHLARTMRARGTLTLATVDDDNDDEDWADYSYANHVEAQRRQRINGRGTR